MAPRVLADTPFATLTIDEPRGIVTLTRTDAPLDFETIERSASSFDELLPVHRRATLGLLFDMRKGPLSRPESEDRLLAFARNMQRGFAGSATVLSTAVGRLQASRIRREGKLIESFVTMDVEEAVAHLEQLLRHRTAAR